MRNDDDRSFSESRVQSHRQPRKREQQVYLHRSCRPIDQIDFSNEKQLGFALECEGGCGL